MNKKHFLKNILTTTSTLALFIGTTEANAALVMLSADPARTSIPTNFSNESMGPFVNGDTVSIGAGASMFVDSVVTLGGIALDAYQPGTLTVTANATIGSIANVRAGQSFTLATEISDGAILTLNGTSTGHLE